MLSTMVIVFALLSSPEGQDRPVISEIRDSFETPALCEEAMYKHIDSLAAQAALQNLNVAVISAACHVNTKGE
jgi:hypothetical protein